MSRLFDLSTHSMKTKLLAAAGQPNRPTILEMTFGRVYSYKETSFLEISPGWRPFTSQARGAKQSLPEPAFLPPRITQSDLQLVQLSLPKNTTTMDSQSTSHKFHPNLMRIWTNRATLTFHQAQGQALKATQKMENR